MTTQELECTEEWLIAKAIQMILKNPDLAGFERTKYMKEYIELTKQGKTRISYLQDQMKIFDKP